MSRRHLLTFAAALAVTGTIACGGNPPPVARPTAPPPDTSTGGVTSSPPGGAPGSGRDAGSAPTSTTVPPPPPTPAMSSDAISADPFVNESTDAINQHSPLQPIFFALDSDQLDDVARHSIEDDAQVLKKYASWVITIEGHCDERGTAEYNLALGERRAVAARAYLVSLGISADRLHTVSYGKEFPFDPGRDDAAFAKNRRAHFVITAK
jgi:peptidoglycan-associated lipoprotein